MNEQGREFTLLDEGDRDYDYECCNTRVRRLKPCRDMYCGADECADARLGLIRCEKCLYMTEAGGLMCHNCGYEMEAT